MVRFQFPPFALPPTPLIGEVHLHSNTDPAPITPFQQGTLVEHTNQLPLRGPKLMTYERHHVGFSQVPNKVHEDLSDRLRGISVEHHLKTPATFGCLGHRMECS